MPILPPNGVPGIVREGVDAGVDALRVRPAAARRIEVNVGVAPGHVRLEPAIPLVATRGVEPERRPIRDIVPLLPKRHRKLAVLRRVVQERPIRHVYRPRVRTTKIRPVVARLRGPPARVRREHRTVPKRTHFPADLVPRFDRRKASPLYAGNRESHRSRHRRHYGSARLGSPGLSSSHFSPLVGFVPPPSRAPPQRFTKTRFRRHQGNPMHRGTRARVAVRPRRTRACTTSREKGD